MPPDSNLFSVIARLEVRLSDSLRRRLCNESDASRRLDIIDEELCPPEPQLLDTSVLQNLDWIDQKTDAAGGVVKWDEEAVAELEIRFGKELATDLIDLGTLYRQFEHYGGYPWCICSAALYEAGVLQNKKGERLRQLISFLSGHQEDWAGDSFPGIAKGLLIARRGTRVSPLLLRALGVANEKDICEDGGPLSFLQDSGDRAIVAQALVANIPVIVTTDRRTFWIRRSEIRTLGVEVLRPSELLDLYIPYWNATDYEFARRRAGFK